MGLNIAKAPIKDVVNFTKLPIFRKFIQAQTKFVSEGSRKPFQVSNLGAEDVSTGIFADPRLLRHCLIIKNLV